jgi:hypothetical protein
MIPSEDVSGEFPLGGTDAIRRLIELAKAEHRLAAEGPVEDLADVQEGLADALASLPRFLDDESRTRLAEAYALRGRTIELLRVARDQAAADVAKLDHGRTAIRGYRPAGTTGATPSVDTAV